MAEPRPDADAAARKLVEIANSVEAVQNGRIYIELTNEPMIFQLKASPAEKAGPDRTVAKGCLELHGSEPM